MIDYVKKERSKKGMRKVAAEEIHDIEGLRRVYANPDRNKEAVLRVFHVQNAWWAQRFLLRKFNIDNASHSVIDTDFGDWVKKSQPERRAGKPVMNGRSWKTTHDPWRGISRTMWVMDYLKQYTAYLGNGGEEISASKFMELNDYDEEGLLSLLNIIEVC